MATYPVDLHTHTSASDGAYTPTELVRQAAAAGLAVLGITDHDTVAGVGEAETAGKLWGVEIVPEVEFSTRHEYEKQFVGIHLLGYFIDPAAPDLQATVQKVQQGRTDQKIRQIEKLRGFGFDISVEEVFDRVKGVPGRPHIAAVLMERHPGRFANVQQIFDEYLGSGARAHVGRQFALTVGQAIEVVKRAGGIPVLAHPGIYRQQIDPRVAVRNAWREGLEGVEVFYPYKQGSRLAGLEKGFIGQMDTLADELKLFKTGGTDFHGRPHEGIEMGDVGLTAQQYTAFKQSWQNLRKAANF